MTVLPSSSSRSIRHPRHRRVLVFILRHTRRFLTLLGSDGEHTRSASNTEGCCHRGSLVVSVRHGVRPQRSLGRRIKCTYSASGVPFVPTRLLQVLQRHWVNNRNRHQKPQTRSSLIPQSPVLPSHSHVRLTGVTTAQHIRSPNVRTSAASFSSNAQVARTGTAVCVRYWHTLTPYVCDQAFNCGQSWLVQG